MECPPAKLRGTPARDRVKNTKIQWTANAECKIWLKCLNKIHDENYVILTLASHILMAFSLFIQMFVDSVFFILRRVTHMNCEIASNSKIDTCQAQ